MNKFNEDRKSGEQYEDFLIDILKQSGFSFVKKSNGNDKVERKEFDLILKKNDKEFKFEVKSDYFSYQTGNEIFEFKCNKQESGILTTKSTFFVVLYVLDNKIVFYNTQDLQKVFKNGAISTSGRITQGGDGNRATLWLIKKDDMKDFCKENNIRRKELDINIPIYDLKSVLKHFQNKEVKYHKIISKLESLI